MIEVEVRSFISEDRYDELLDKLKERAEKVKYDRQITYYFSGDRDLRIQKNMDFAKLWLKTGEIHEREREELEVRFDREDFRTLEKLLELLGYEVEIKWYRERHRFRWNGLEICVDHTPGYGRIIEIEKMCEKGEEEKVHERLCKALREFGVEETPKEIFDERYEDYRDNWSDILEDRDLSSFRE